MARVIGAAELPGGGGLVRLHDWNRKVGYGNRGQERTAACVMDRWISGYVINQRSSSHLIQAGTAGREDQRRVELFRKLEKEVGRSVGRSVVVYAAAPVDDDVN